MSNVNWLKYDISLHIISLLIAKLIQQTIGKSSEDSIDKIEAFYQGMYGVIIFRLFFKEGKETNNSFIPLQNISSSINLSHGFH